MMLHTILIVALAQNPWVLLDGEYEPTLEAALGKMTNGSVIELGPGVHLVSPGVDLVDVKIVGASAYDTILLAVDPYGPTFITEGDCAIQSVAMIGAELGVQVDSGVTVLENVILRGCSDAAIRLMSDESFALVNFATIAQGGVGVDVWEGGAMVTNSAFTENAIAYRTYVPAGHEYNLYDKNAVEIEGDAMTATEKSAPATFIDAAAGDFREASGSATIDAGDPAADATAEPQPNGQRANVGAFGNTSLAATTESESTSVPAIARASGGRGSSCAMSVPEHDAAPALLAAAALAAMLALRRRS